MISGGTKTRVTRRHNIRKWVDKQLIYGITMQIYRQLKNNIYPVVQAKKVADQWSLER